MKVEIHAVGKIKKGYWREAADDYLKRIRRFAKIAVREIRDCPPHNKTAEQLRADESLRLHEGLPDQALVIALDQSGSQMTSPSFADFFQKKALNSGRPFCFCIGGSEGLTREFVARAEVVLSLSEMTLPHELARVVLLEQIYRALSILNHTKYHK